MTRAVSSRPRAARGWASKLRHLAHRRARRAAENRRRACFISHARRLITLLIVTAQPVMAQINPAADWKTIRTENFYVHFTPPLEAIARRAAVQAESAYALIAQHLTKPRGKIDLL